MTSIIDVSKYAHSPVHKAIITKDYATLRKILNGLPRFSDPAQIPTEAASLAEEHKADAISSVIDRRDVPNRDTPLHLAVKFGQESAVEMLMLAGADSSLQNELGWSALQEAICNRDESIVKTIVRHCQPLAWAKWCRRLPRLISTMRRMRDFYMEITFHFESLVIPFISRIAPSDTYKIWKRGANLRADMTLAGFDGFNIQRADQSILFLGDGREEEGHQRLPPGTLCMIYHQDKEVMNALDGAGAQASEEELQQEVALMSQTNIIRPGIDVTQAVLLPQLTWRRQEKTEFVGVWKSKVYDMHNVVVSIKSRKVPGAMTDEEFLSLCNGNETGSEEEDERQLNDILTDEERRQLEVALKFDSSEVSNENGDGFVAHRHSCYEARDIPIEEEEEKEDSCGSSTTSKQEKKGWFSSWRRREPKNNKGAQRRNDPPRSSLRVEEKVSDLLGDSPPPARGRGNRTLLSSNAGKGGNHLYKEANPESSEYKKGLRPVLWLSSDFPLRTEELLPLLDILANKVKAIRRLKELLTTKLPLNTFPVKVAIPVVPTIKVLVTFTKFEELQPINEEEFSTPPSSPNDAGVLSPSGSSWFQWIKAPYQRTASSGSSSNRIETVQDPFAIPRDYTSVTGEAKKKRMQEKYKAKKNKGQKNQANKL